MTILPLLKRELKDFDILLENNVLKIQMKSHYAKELEARKIVEPFLRCWELDTALSIGNNAMEFVFTTSEIIDRTPPLQGQPITMQISSSIYGVASIKAKLLLTKKEYPQPPINMCYSADVESIWKRYQSFIEGREPLLSMAYFCLTVLQARANGQREIPNKYMIDIKVLKKLGELTSERGDTSEARKLQSSSNFKSLTANEKNWIQELIKKIIRRKAEYDFDPSIDLPLITMNSLPNIN